MPFRIRSLKADMEELYVALHYRCGCRGLKAAASTRTC